MVVDVTPAQAFQVGDQVEKHGSYVLAGVVVAAFRTLAGEERYVVEHWSTVPGLLHIYGSHNLRPLNEEET